MKANRIRPLAVTFAKRVDEFPDLPTVAEAGVPGFAVDNWYGFQAPRGTPKHDRREAARRDQSHPRRCPT